MLLKRGVKKAQLTIFIVVAVVIIGLVAGFFLLRGKIFSEQIPPNIEPVYSAFLSCLEDDTSTGINLLGFQAGYIEMPKFEPGSSYMPFSNQLDFLGNPIPYWYYVSGNNIQKEQVPTLEDMQNQLESFIQEKIKTCNFNDFYNQGFEITIDNQTPEVRAVISKDKVDVDMNMKISFSKGEDNAIVSTHKISVKSKIGALYESAKKIYQYEQKNIFLENYAVDTLRIYAPVDGVEMTCSPKVWNSEEVFNRLEDAIEANTLALKTKGGSYTLTNAINKYFIVDVSVDEDVRFINSKNWTKSFEVEPSEGAILISKPVGNQPGLGILGFCYVPYHFIYNIKYPVLVQISDGEELFQFPVAVVLQGNKPRNPLNVSASELVSSEVCKYENNPLKINVYDASLNEVSADISFECLGAKCEIGKTKLGEGLSANFPQCGNGFIVAKAEGYQDSRNVISTTTSGSVDIILNKLYEKNIDLKLNGGNYGGSAIITFTSGGASNSIAYPEQKTIELSEGQYEVQVYIYKNTSIKLSGQKMQQCMDVPKSGVGGLLGFTEKKCFDVDIPEQIISNALIGGGKQNYYILESELTNSNTIEISAASLPVPTSLEELQNNYNLFEDKNLEINFK
jgi:hypothetical protein